MAAKDDKGKLKLSLVPSQIIRDIAQVREYGCQKYHDPENWRQVEVQRYIDAFYRHWLKFIEDPNAIDEESGIPHYKHCACNMAFICEMLKNGENGRRCTMRVHDKELFDSHCPYTDELCDSWECDTCEVEQEELQMRKELYKDGESE